MSTSCRRMPVSKNSALTTGMSQWTVRWQDVLSASHDMTTVFSWNVRGTEAKYCNKHQDAQIFENWCQIAVARNL